MSIKPWVIVESPDSRGLRAITIHGEKVDSAWSLRELRRVLRRLGYPDDMDLDDPSCVLWRGGGSSTWPGKGWRRYAVMVLMVLGLLASLGLHVVIGWPDALGALTFAQRLIGVLILVAAAVEGLAAVAVIDYWGRRQLRISGAFVFLGVLIALATTSLLLFLWLEEHEFIPALPFFVSLWGWSIWATFVLIHNKVWRGIPHPKKFAAGVAVTAALSAVSLGYSTLYAPTAVPMHFKLKADFGTPRTSWNLPYIHVPLALYAKNDGQVPVYIVVDDYTVFGYSSKFSRDGQGLQEWKHDDDYFEPAEAERYESEAGGDIVASGQFQGPGTVLDAGEEFRIEKVITLPKDTKFETLDAKLQFAVLRQDRGRVNEYSFFARPSWQEDEGRYYCQPEECGERLLYHSRVSYNNNLINVTRKPRYVLAHWSPEEPADIFVSSYDFKKKGTSILDAYKKLDPKDSDEERRRYGIWWTWVNHEVSVHGLLKQTGP
ncbi:Yip1 family protein [Streptomyces sp. SP17KL33]|uniref:Yip1 family protein n=1 Tax=Streptomyces sp. SP17KL33 TaxID=3002534 RepID=UPI002E79EDE3|nr:Yip1 family protein [Streptomyces sp. SP17KL33]MEE1837452.1 Yip1 family protein [Streptomyces sp. SP17KL33]